MTRRYEHEDEFGFSAVPNYELIRLAAKRAGADVLFKGDVENVYGTEILGPQSEPGLSAEDRIFLKECGISL